MAKKSIGVYDSYQYQDYAVDLTPSWARRVQSLGHIEGRYGYASVPGALLCLFILVAALPDTRPRMRHVSAAALVPAGVSFLVQTSAWGASDDLLQRIERGLAAPPVERSASRVRIAKQEPGSANRSAPRRKSDDAVTIGSTYRSR